MAMSGKFIYIVTNYGCNSTPSDLWTPQTKLFTNYKDAYSYFLKISPYFNDRDNEVDQKINKKYDHEDMTMKDYIVIEYSKHKPGYHSGEPNKAKRPQGAVIARYYLPLSL